MKINKLVFAYYSERLPYQGGLFAEYANNKRVSIHQIVNHNGGAEPYDVNRFFMARSNDLNLLRSVISRGGNVERYMWRMSIDPGHKRRFHNFQKWAKRIECARLKVSEEK